MVGLKMRSLLLDQLNLLSHQVAQQSLIYYEDCSHFYYGYIISNKLALSLSVMK